jgi:hypothetical protein
MKLPLPSSKQEVTMTFYSGPTRDMKYGFIVQWWDENFHLGPRWRGQVFLSNNIAYYNQCWSTGGRKVVVIDYRPLSDTEKKKNPIVF